ncbi:mannose-6-phosphate isomerase-like protein (cupin superfamily) [Actinomadura pelletieri DSM 43383]|uniref:Mannose-6-phosphate isomerase-like protein (Cupin superfamily) n=1 Tax=Actinomadura pelletieri DSM 43383 TaxID=1120940 RepID=A0A495QST5_9ACTN|nr:cupin domain-containing protein [Actinomadura pelletieri]RKS76508.1 mannose-6-phosphate isomerase-like protein (cupin superfamily) [Actinomadura pelletieri DSM 43383]
MTLRYEDSDLAAFTDSLILTRATRQEDWDTLGFQAKAGDQFRRAQIRYVGSGATGDHEGDRRTIPSRGFTFSNMLLPPGAEGPEHTHHDAEEAFFVLEGEIEVGIHRDGQVEKRTLGYRDMIVVPAGTPRSLKNNGGTDALFCVIIGTRKPQVPTYPETSAMHGVSRD